MKKTARQALLEVMETIRPEPEKWIAVHELTMIPNHSQNSMATELSIMAKDDLVISRYRVGKRFKEWRPAPNLAVKPSFPPELEAA